MSGVYQSAVTARALIQCDARGCRNRWESAIYFTHDGNGGAPARIGPALDLGWRIFAGARSQHTYCPEHGPRTEMRLVRGGTR